jgi:electron transport complex protein RnfC
VMKKIEASPREALEKKIAQLKERIVVTEGKIAEADDGSVIAALQKGLAKQQEKLHDAEQQLIDAPSQAVEVATGTEDAAAAAIAKAQAKAAAQASMTDEEKLRATITSLQGRLQKAQERLSAAEAEGSEHIDALRTAAEKLEAKLTSAEAELSAL